MSAVSYAAVAVTTACVTILVYKRFFVDALLINQQLSPLKTKKQEPDPLLLDEQLSRSSLFFGEQGQENVKKARIAVIGLGGVEFLIAAFYYLNSHRPGRESRRSFTRPDRGWALDLGRFRFGDPKLVEPACLGHTSRRWFI